MNRITLHCCSVGALLLSGMQSVQAANIAGTGTAIMGVNSAIDSTLGTPYIQFGSTLSINDGVGAGGSNVDTYNGGQPHQTSTVSYVGITFATPVTDVVTTLTLTSASFFDGGWFGPNNSGPGASGVLSDVHLIEPTVQISLDGGVTWSAIAATSDYSAALAGIGLPVAFGPPTIATSTFTLTTPVTGITGIRLIGSEGGTASGGFLGVTELAVNAEVIPEPASFALTGVAAGLLLRRRRRRGPC